jgi:hypothetical protein
VKACHKGLYLYKTKQTQDTTLPSADFEPAIPAIKRLQNYALDGKATGIGWNNN